MASRRFARLLLLLAVLASAFHGCSAFMTAEARGVCYACEVRDRFTDQVMYRESVCGVAEKQVFMDDFHATSRRFVARCE